MGGNKEMIDQLVSDSALKSLDTLNVKLTSSYDEMEKLLTKVQQISTELSAPAKSYIELAKAIEKVEKAERTKQKIDQEQTKILKEEKELIDQVIGAKKEQTKENEKQEQSTKKLEKTTKELLSATERTAKGIDVSAYIKENENGLKNYSNAINAVNQQLGIIDGLQDELNKKFNTGAISEEEYSNAITGLTQKQSEYIITLESLREKYEKAGEAQKSVFDPASEAFNNLSPRIQQQSLYLVELNAELNNTRAAQKELDKQYKDGEITLEIYVKKKAQLNELENVQSNSVKNLSKELQLNQQIANTSIGSYDNLSARYSLMKIQINALGEAEGENAEQKRKLEKESKALYQQMNELQKATGKAQLQVGDYTLINKDLESALNTVNPALGGTVSGIKSATKAAMAFIATPIGVVLGIIAAALMSLASWFKRTEEGQNALSVATAGFEKVLNSVLNVVDKVGEWLFKAFTSPKEAIIELGNLIVNNILNRLKALSKAGEAIVKIFSEDWKNGFKDLGNAVAQGFTGVENTFDKIKNGINDTIEGAKRAADIQSKMNDLATKKRNLNEDEAKSIAEMNKLRNIANESERSISERLAANNKYIELANKLAERKAEIAKEELRLRTDQINENKRGSALSIEEKEEISKLTQEVSKIEAENAQMLYTSTRTNNSLRREGANKQKEAIREQNKELKALGELESFNYRKSADLQEQLYKDVTLSFDERKTALRAYIDDEIKIIQIKAAEEVKQEGLTTSQKKLIQEKALYEIFKLDQKYSEEKKSLNIKEAEHQLKTVQESISKRSEEINDAMQKELVFASKVYEEAIEKHGYNEQKRKDITEDYQKKRLEIIREYNQKAFEDEVNQLSKTVDNTDLTEDKKIEIRKKINELQKKNAKDLAEYEINQTEDKVDKMLDAEEQFNKILNDKRTQALMSMWNIALDTANMYYDAQISKIDELEKREKEYYDERLKVIEENVASGLMSEEEASARKRILEEEQLDKEKEYDKQRREMQRKQAIWQKANSILQATINTGQAVTMAYASLPFPANIVAAAIVGALGAAQIAMITAQQIPAYAKGTDNHPGGWARVGDGGRSEMVIYPSGEVWKTPSSDTYAYLPKGTEVLPDYKKAMMEMHSFPIVSYYDDTEGKMIYLHDNVLRNNTKETNNQLSSINRGINAIRVNNIYSTKRNGSFGKMGISSYKN